MQNSMEERQYLQLIQEINYIMKLYKRIFTDIIVKKCLTYFVKKTKIYVQGILGKCDH